MTVVKTYSLTSDLGTAPVSRLIARLALPSVASQVVQVAYNIVDRIYIAHIPGEEGTLALTGVGVTLPLLLIVTAFAVMCGMGGSPLAAIELGRAEHDTGANERAAWILGNAWVMLMFFAAVITVVFLLFAHPLLTAFGASGRTVPYALRYFRIYISGTIFMLLATGLNPFISAQGHAKTAMTGVLLGAVLNMGLDPILIFACNMGVAGAAYATVASQAVSMTWIVSFLLSKKSAIALSKRSFLPRPSVIARIAALGISPFMMQVTESAVGATLNTGLRNYGGDNYVAVMTVLQSLMQMCYVPISGLTNGSQPIISYNYGAKKIARARLAARNIVSTSTVVSAVSYAVMVLFSKRFVSFFITDGALAELAAAKLPVYFGAMFLFGVQMGAQSVFVALGKARTSLFIACLRKVILLIPLALILPLFFGVDGIFWSEPIASATSALTSGIMLAVCMKRELRIGTSTQKL